MRALWLICSEVQFRSRCSLCAQFLLFRLSFARVFSRALHARVGFTGCCALPAFIICELAQCVRDYVRLRCAHTVVTYRGFFSFALSRYISLHLFLRTSVRCSSSERTPSIYVLESIPSARLILVGIVARPIYAVLMIIPRMSHQLLQGKSESHA